MVRCRRGPQFPVHIMWACSIWTCPPQVLFQWHLTLSSNKDLFYPSLLPKHPRLSLVSNHQNETASFYARLRGMVIGVLKCSRTLGWGKNRVRVRVGVRVWVWVRFGSGHSPKKKLRIFSRGKMTSCHSGAWKPVTPTSTHPFCFKKC